MTTWAPNLLPWKQAWDMKLQQSPKPKFNPDISDSGIIYNDKSICIWPALYASYSASRPEYEKSWTG